jgi:hypothetical protein
MQRHPKIEIVCAECGVSFRRYASLLNPNSKHYYCSRACLGGAKRHGSQVFCALCDTPFYRRFGEQKSATSQFCSRTCYMEWRAINRSPDTYPRVGAMHVHRIVAAAVLGRALLPGEVVHHIDGDKQNNHPANLAVFPDQATHARCHFGEMSADELRGFSLSEAASR